MNINLLDSACLEPGDLILFSHKTPNKASQSIIDTQKIIGFEHEHAKWHHAVISVGGTKLIESAIFKKVQYAPASSYNKLLGGKFDFKILRVKNINDAQRSEIASSAAELIGRKYDYWTIIIYRSIRHFGKDIRTPKGKRLNCATLFVQACWDRGIELESDLRLSLITPAHLSKSKQLQTIEPSYLSA